MMEQKSHDIASLTTKAVASIDTYQATQNEQTRQDALASAISLVRALETPGDAIYKLFASPAILMAVKTASDLNVFTVLSDRTSPASCEELAGPKNADIQLVERIMRVLVCNGFASELGPGQYMPTDLSRKMTERKAIGTMDSLFIDFLPIIQKTPEFFQKSNYKNPGDPNGGPLQHAYNTTGSCWDWLAKNPDALGRFNTFMEGGRDDTSHWADWFPVQERLLDRVSPDRPLLVDVGGGRGHDLEGFKQRFPVEAGKLVLEDLPSVIDDIQHLDGDIQRIKHSFFEPQPVQGARAYYFKHIMHDWSDDKCRVILRHITTAMERGFSKLLIEDYIIPDQNARLKETLTDMIVMVWCPGIERTRQRWTELLESVGLRVIKFWLPHGYHKGIIEAELQ
ncbi:Demethylsterigmatocystin 6-O-methyltransferase [Talaromyces pinophilus]|nr:Demethylsterigmatocystin 6-O-methyltransferase [Talaromyces pinophilus]